jgi:hypothetical protein
MITTFPTDVVALSPEYVLAVIRDEHRQMSRIDLEIGTPGILRFDTTVQQWQMICLLCGTADLAVELSRKWDFQYREQEWRAVLEPSDRRTLRDVCAFIASRAVRQVIRPARFFGRPCEKAGAFLTVRSMLHRAGADVGSIAPSTELAPYTTQYLELFVGPVSRLAPNRLPGVTIHPLYTTWGCLFAIGAMALGWISGWRVGWIAPWLFILCRVLVALETRFMPAKVEFGELRTFRDLAEAMVEGGYCAVCDYNLRGNISGVCPECGNPIELEAQAV